MFMNNILLYKLNMLQSSEEELFKHTQNDQNIIGPPAAPHLH